jgi:hypothetical protein
MKRLVLLLLLASCGPGPARYECLRRDEDKVASCMAGCRSGPVGAFSGEMHFVVADCLERCGEMFCKKSALRVLRSGTWCASAVEPADVEACNAARRNKP